eukprot:3892290-Pyramimonas_sp.AAC.2
MGVPFRAPFRNLFRGPFGFGVRNSNILPIIWSISRARASGYPGRVKLNTRSMPTCKRSDTSANPRALGNLSGSSQHPLGTL